MTHPTPLTFGVTALLFVGLALFLGLTGARWQLTLMSGFASFHLLYAAVGLFAVHWARIRHQRTQDETRLDLYTSVGVRGLFVLSGAFLVLTAVMLTTLPGGGGIVIALATIAACLVGLVAYGAWVHWVAVPRLRQKIDQAGAS